jgi:hypothetical protein
MELVQGMRNARELKNLQADLTLWQVTTLPITKAISERAVKLVEEHFLAHHLQLADAHRCHRHRTQTHYRYLQYQTLPGRQDTEDRSVQAPLAEQGRQRALGEPFKLDA